MSGLELHEACAVGDTDALEECLKTGKFDPNLKDIEWGYRTAMHWAAGKGFVDCIRLLLDYGANGTARMTSGWTPAHVAAETGKLTVLRFLHANHVAIDKPDKYGDTPRRVAEIYNQIECIKYLEQSEKECEEKRSKGKLIYDTDEDIEQYKEIHG